MKLWTKALTSGHLGVGVADRPPAAGPAQGRARDIRLAPVAHG